MGDAELTVIINYRFSPLAGVYCNGVCLRLPFESYLDLQHVQGAAGPASCCRVDVFQS